MPMAEMTGHPVVIAVSVVALILFFNVLLFNKK